MIQVLLKLFASPIVDAVVRVFDKYQTTQVNKEKLRSEVNRAVLDSIKSTSDKQRSIIEREIGAEDKVTRVWRPVTALAFSFVILWYSFLGPITVNWFGFPPLQPGDTVLEWIYTLTTIMIGGYMGGRTIEKVVTSIIRGYK